MTSGERHDGGLRWRTWGVGGRRILLLHGSTSSASTWWQVGPSLAAEGWQVTAVDLPGHGGNPSPVGPVLPTTSADAVTDSFPGARFELVVGHSYGAAVAVHLAVQNEPMIGRVVLEELPGPSSVDWSAEAQALPAAAAEARRDPAGCVASTRAAQPRWSEEDCVHAVADLTACAAGPVADGLRAGPSWTPPEVLPRVAVPVTLLLAPDAAGVNRLEDATALRDDDRRLTAQHVRARVRVVEAGHCIHRDDPGAWLGAVREAAADLQA